MCSFWEPSNRSNTCPNMTVKIRIIICDVVRLKMQFSEMLQCNGYTLEFIIKRYTVLTLCMTSPCMYVFFGKETFLWWELGFKVNTHVLWHMYEASSLVVQRFFNWNIHVYWYRRLTQHNTHAPHMLSVGLIKVKLFVEMYSSDSILTVHYALLLHWFIFRFLAFLCTFCDNFIQFLLFFLNQ